MAHFDTPRPAPFGAITTFRFVSAIEKALDAVRVWNDSRKTEDQLSRLSDHELEDIGLHRGEIGSFAEGFAARR